MEATKIVAKNDDKANEEKSLAELVYDAYKKNEANYPYLMEKVYLQPEDEQAKVMNELQSLMADEYGPEAD